MKLKKDVYPAGWEKMTVEQKLCHMVGKYEKLDPWGSDTETLMLTTTARPWNAELTGYGVAIQFSSGEVDLLRDKPVKEEEFDENSIPAELVDILKEDACEYPNIISAGCHSKSCHEAVDRMMLKLELLKYGYRFGNYREYKEDHPEFFVGEE